jgi:CubicO group peptidase (beta-lactamase class C family)
MEKPMSVILPALLISAMGWALPPQPEPAPPIVKGESGKRIDDLLERFTTFGFSGAALVARGGEILLAKGYGLADRSREIPNRPDTLFEIASTSKQFTAAAILQLESGGKLKTSDSISRHLPAVPEADRKVTIFHLLTHTSGFPRNGPTGGGPDLEKATSDYLRSKRAAEPGKHFEYFNGGYALLAAIVERTSGMPFPDYCRKNLFEPAGMTATSFCQDPIPDGIPMAHGYDDDHDAGLANAHSFGWEYRGMGGVVTSVMDLYRWDRALRAGKILDKAALEKQVTPFLESYACGWYVTCTSRGTRRAEHGGNVKGFESEFIRFLDEDATVIVLANRCNVHWQVGEDIANALFGEPFRVSPPPPTTPLGPESLQQLAGEYELPSKDRLVVRAEAGRLRVGAEGIEAMRILLPAKEPKDKSEFEKERQLAESVVTDLAHDDTKRLRDLLPKDAPWAARWPDDLRTSIWPRHVQTCGAFSSAREIGARKQPDGSVRVWVRLVHEKGERAAEVVFSQGRLTILDLDGRDFPATAFYGPVGERRFASYDFDRPAAPPIRFEAASDGKAVRLVVASASGEPIVARRLESAK